MSNDENENENEKNDRSSRHPLNLRTYNSVIDEQLARAQANGLMNNLPGEGKPQDLYDDVHIPADQRLGYRMLKGNNFSTPWLEARKDIDEERRRIDAWLVHANGRWLHLGEAGREQLRGEFRAKLQALNSQILTYNLQVPASVGQMRGIIIGDELRRLGVE